MKIALYARISTINQGQDPETQLLPLRDYSKRRGFEVVGEFVDTISGVKEKRPSLDDLLKRARKREFDCVVVWKLDRLGRSLKHLISVVEEFESLGIQFISLTEGMDTTTPSGKLLFNIIGSIAGFERDLIRERVKSGLERAKNQGKKLGRPSVDLNKDLVFQYYYQGLSLREIAERMSVSYSTVFRILHKSNQLQQQSKTDTLKCETI